MELTGALTILKFSIGQLSPQQLALSVSAITERGDTGSIQDESDRVSHIEHYVVNGAGVLVGAVHAALVGSFAGARNGGEGAIENSNDLTDGNFLRGPG